MRIAYLDCFAGISGDMFLGALLDAGVDPKVLHEAVATLDLNATLKIEKVDRSGSSSTKVHVYEGDHPAEKDHGHHEHTHNHAHDHPHTHEQEHKHNHGRSLIVIRNLINAANLPPAVKQTAIQTFEL